MNNTRIEWKVGLFVLVCLGLMIALVVKFSKGTSIFTPTYDIHMRTENVSGLIPGAAVLMSGVQIGNVVGIELAPDGKTASVRLEIEERFNVYPDARFAIRQMGFLGDRYIAVIPTENEGKPLESGETVRAEQPLDFEEVAQSAAGLLTHVNDTAVKLNQAIDRLDQSVLSQQTLTNLATTVSNFKQVSDQALVTFNGINDFVRTNSHPLSTSVSNLVGFSSQLNQVATHLHVIVETNRADLRAVVKNIESTTSELDALVAELQQGKGLAGSLLKDEQLQAQFASTMENLNVLSSNLSKYGILWKPRVQRNPASTRAPYTGKNPHQ